MKILCQLGNTRRLILMHDVFGPRNLVTVDIDQNGIQLGSIQRSPVFNGSWVFPADVDRRPLAENGRIDRSGAT